MLGLIEKLTNLNGVSGDEGRVRRFIKAELAPLGLEMKTDTMGNLIVHKPGKGRRVMLAAHMDEVGMIVTYITDTGMLAYNQRGLDPRVVVSKRVVVGDDEVPGVIGAKAIHLQSRDELKRALPHSELYVDIGAKDKDDALKYVKPGDHVSFTTKFAMIGDGLVKAKALDDRVGCAIIMKLLQNSYGCDLYAVFTVQEELGLRGAMAAAYSVEPEVALVLEGTTCNDMPDAKEHQYVTRVGSGPVITFMDGGTIVRRKMFEAEKQTATEAGIPWQLKKATTGGTDAGAIHKTRAGCVTGGISVPCRYIHSPASIAAVSDIENSYRLADAFLKTKKFDEVI